MSTPTSPTEANPTRMRVLVVDESALRPSIVAYLERVAQTARDAAANPELAIGVHELRKAARRVRAVAELVREVIPSRERRRIRDAVRDARRVLGPARDHAVAAHVVPKLVLDEPVREAASVVLHAASFDAPSAEATRAALVESAEIVAAQADALRDALPEELAIAALVEGVQVVYRRARRARKAAKRSRRAFHTWRRRTKELAYQLDVLGDAANERLVELRQGLRDVAEAQRDAVDLLMVRNFVRAHRDLVDRDAAALLVGALDDQLRPLLSDVRRAGKPAFAARPRSLSRGARRRERAHA